MAEVSNKGVILKRFVTGFPSEDDMELVAGTMRLALPPGSPAFLVKNLYVSCDPYLRNRMSQHNDAAYIEQFVPGEVLIVFGVSKVVASGHPGFKAGDLVWGQVGCQEYSVIAHPEYLFKINPRELPLSYYTGVLGMPGLTAYTRFFDVSKPKKGDYVFVSAASGAVGQLVGQLAKITGCYVVGSAGSDEKMDARMRWMYGERRCSEFITCLHKFLDVAEANKVNNFMPCPCDKCRNVKEYSDPRTIQEHVIRKGFMPSYNCWTKHGERGVRMEDNEEEEDDDS